MEATAAPIGVFDSGLGGLTVLRALIDLLPGESTIYFGDTGRFPYGPKPADEVLKYSLEIADVLVDRGAQMIVVACNSATSVALDALGEPPRDPRDRRGRAGRARRGRRHRDGSRRRHRHRRHDRERRVPARRRSAGVHLTCAACPGFVEFVEAGDVDSDQVHVLAERLLAPVRGAGIDTLILGCTHYPLLARTIGDVMGPDVVLVSSADETAFAALRMVDGIRRPAPAPNTGS